MKLRSLVLTLLILTVMALGWFGFEYYTYTSNIENGDVLMDDEEYGDAIIYYESAQKVWDSAEVTIKIKDAKEAIKDKETQEVAKRVEEENSTKKSEYDYYLTWHETHIDNANKIGKRFNAALKDPNKLTDELYESLLSDSNEELTSALDMAHKISDEKLLAIHKLWIDIVEYDIEFYENAKAGNGEMTEEIQQLKSKVHNDYLFEMAAYEKALFGEQISEVKN